MAQKDIVTMINTMNEPHAKLLAFNKIFYEITKKYGRDAANEWLELVWNGSLYMHDAPSSSYMPYCYVGTECITIKYKNQIKYINFADLFDLVEEPIDRPEQNVERKITNDLFVLDLVDGKQKWSKILQVVRRPNNKKIQFIKVNNGLSCLTTEDHPYITSQGTNNRAYYYH